MGEYLRLVEKTLIEAQQKDPAPDQGYTKVDMKGGEESGVKSINEHGYEEIEGSTDSSGAPRVSDATIHQIELEDHHQQHPLEGIKYHHDASIDATKAGDHKLADHHSKEVGRYTDLLAKQQEEKKADTIKKLGQSALSYAKYKKKLASGGSSYNEED